MLIPELGGTETGEDLEIVCDDVVVVEVEKIKV